MERLTYNITDENRRRLEILRAFSILNRGSPTIQDIVNQSIQDYFVTAYERYCTQCATNDFLKEAMEEMLPQTQRLRLSFGLRPEQKGQPSPLARLEISASHSWPLSHLHQTLMPERIVNSSGPLWLRS